MPQIKKFKVNLRLDLVAWWVPALFTIVCGALGATSDNPWHFRIVCAVIPVIFCGVFTFRTWLRIKFQRSIRFYTDLGIGVRYLHHHDPKGLSPGIDICAMDVAEYWHRQGFGDGKTDCFNGAILSFEDEIYYHWAGPVRKVGGLQMGNYVSVEWSNNNLVTSRLRHEFSHLYLERHTHPDFDHHALMTKVGFKDV